MKKIEELEQKLAELLEEISQLKQQQNNRYPMKLIDLGLWTAIGSRNYDFNKYLKFAELVETCREWNRIDGLPDLDSGIRKYGVVYRSAEGIITGSTGYSSYPLHFQDRDTANLFLETFRTEIESVKDLI